MTKKSRWAVRGVLTAIVIAALAGCGQNTNTAQTTQTETQTETQGTETETQETQAEETAQEAPAEDTQENSQEPQAENNTQNPASSPENDNNGSTLVVYFSATGSTEAVAGYIAEHLGADTYAIVPEEPYSSADLNWTDDSSRVSIEHKNPDSRPAIAGEIIHLGSYDTIFLGYPIWWGEAPNIVRTFMESVELTGKKVVPFCTSSSSGLGSSAKTLKDFAPDAEWLEGQRFPSSVSEEDVIAWVEGLGLS